MNAQAWNSGDKAHLRRMATLRVSMHSYFILYDFLDLRVV
ncbi:hypothetical protein SAMN05216308_11361 [Nitrosospira sp. Nsp13]|nr:hypothetical protein SAMN05216308_11361 [Nitrosospira sp. Nsp13]